MNDNIPHSTRDIVPHSEEDIASANSDISHLIPYFSLGNQEFIKALSNPYSLFDQFGIAPEELEYILQDK